MDEEVAPADIPKQWQEARANRQMQFKVGNYRDGSGESNIRLLTGTIKCWLDTAASWAIPCCATNVETRCHRWGIQAERCCPLGDYQRGEVATFSLSSQWIVFGGLVCRSLWLTNCLAGGLHDGGWSSSQGRWLWLSRLEEKVWCTHHVGRSWPAMASLTEPTGGERTLAGTLLLNSKRGSSQISPNGRVMTWKRPCVLMMTL